MIGKLRDRCAAKAADILSSGTTLADGPISTAKLILLVNEAVVAGAILGIDIALDPNDSALPTLGKST